ncbi:MAG: M48 family metallopeptidase [Ignavibacteriales bacterium]|nr:M48 family metallopeptidase [Ignavibacteriales bacterium]
MQTEAKKYNNIKLAVGITKGVVSFILLLLFVLLGYSLKLENFTRNFFSNGYIVLTANVFVIGAVSSVLFFPVSYFAEFYLEHKYNLSNQTFWKWIWENIKETLVGTAIGLPILLLFYFVLNFFGEGWWLPFGVIMFIISVLLARIVPIFIIPLFYKVTPVEDDELKSRIIELSKDAGLKVENIFKFDMSKNTKKANAAFTGLGKSKRILLGDTLVNGYSHDEIETVIAHELGHYKNKHIVKNIFTGTLFSFLTFFLIAKLYSLSIGWFGFKEIVQISALPLLVLWGSLIGLILNPITNIISRKFEYEADEYAAASTNKKEAFISTLNKLTDQNLGDREPHPLIEWFFYSHPSIQKRISALEKTR